MAKTRARGGGRLKNMGLWEPFHLKRPLGQKIFKILKNHFLTLKSYFSVPNEIVLLCNSGMMWITRNT
jgi:hypothetical protein